MSLLCLFPIVLPGSHEKPTRSALHGKSVLLHKAEGQRVEGVRGVVLIAAHQHEYKYDAPTKDRPWAQMVGGGPDIDRDELNAPTVIEGCVENGKLKITAHSVKTDAVLGSYTFAPRKRR